MVMNTFRLIKIGSYPGGEILEQSIFCLRKFSDLMNDLISLNV